MVWIGPLASVGNGAFPSKAELGMHFAVTPGPCQCLSPLSYWRDALN